MVAANVCSLSYKASKKEGLNTILQVIGASLFLALCAQISLPHFFGPIPLSGQTFAVMLIGATMGSRKAVLSVLAYLIEGGLGFPFFCHGSCGFISLLGPCGGYFFGFLFQAYLVGWFMERKVSVKGSNILLILLLSCAIQLTFGILWLSFLVGFESALLVGLYPFLPGEIIKAIGLTTYLTRVVDSHEKNLSLQR